MPKFMGIHTLPPGEFTREQLSQFAQVAQQYPTVQGYRSFANLSEGNVVCILEAPSRTGGRILLAGCPTTASPNSSWKAIAV